MSIVVVLRPGQSGNDVYLRPDRSALIDVYLYSGQTGNDVYLRRAARPVDAVEAAPPPAFPTQYSGLRVRHGGGTYDLCMVATADAPAAMGGQPRIRKGGTTYAVYLVDTTDPDASPVRLRTSAGTKAIRLKT